MSKLTLADHVLDVLRTHEPGRLLDVPSGGGPIREGALRLGYEVVHADLFPLEPGFRGVRADACGALPFRDGSFDVVVSMEGIEHFENQAAFVREVARVLAPGGLLVLTTPNVMHLSARFSAFWTGERAMKRGFVSEDTTIWGREGTRVYHGHAFLIDVVRLRYLLRIEGLSIAELRQGRWSEGSLLGLPLVPLVWLATRFSMWMGRRTRRKEGRPPTTPEVERDLKRVLDSPALLLSRQLIVVARKSAARQETLEPFFLGSNGLGQCGRELPARPERVRAGEAAALERD